MRKAPAYITRLDQVSQIDASRRAELAPVSRKFLFLLTGGDPLLMSTRLLEGIIERVREIDHEVVALARRLDDDGDPLEEYGFAGAARSVLAVAAS